MSQELAKKSREAALKLQSASTFKKNKALEAIRDSIVKSKQEILEANLQDLNKSELSSSLSKRLDMSKKFDDLINGINDVVKLEDPVGKVTMGTRLDTGLDLYKVSCPIGVLLVIFEARPEVVVQISTLAIKSGNAVILKGGKEALNTNEAIFKAIRNALLESEIPAEAVQLVSTRQDISNLLVMDQYIDLVIPRGSKQLVNHIKSNTKIPVLGHADGICSIFVDQTADQSKAIDVIVDAKTSYPAACNSVEILLIHRDALHLLNPIATALMEKKVVLKCDKDSFSLLKNVKLATDDELKQEFLDLIIAIKVVDSMQEAIDYININGSHHTECILTESASNAEQFMNSVDSAGVYWNASTRFADGFRYGFGAEIGVSTNKTHARGPVGLEGLLIYKYKLYGNGHSVTKTSSFIHEPLK